jgi:hypothetical protein
MLVLAVLEFELELGLIELSLRPPLAVTAGPGTLPGTI